jgi:hypothetical protein
MLIMKSIHVIYTFCVVNIVVVVVVVVINCGIAQLASSKCGWRGASQAGYTQLVVVRKDLSSFHFLQL